MNPTPRKIFVAGATGALGRAMTPHLVQRGHHVVAGSRQPQRAAKSAPELPWAAFDVDDLGGMTQSLHGHDVLLYLVHQMDGSGNLVERESRAARRVARAAAKAGVGRIVFMGSVQPKDDSEPSAHILARAMTGEALRTGDVPVVELQGSMVIGASSESWRIVRDLAVRLPVMVLPAWLQQETRPVAMQDVVAALTHACERDLDGDIVADLPGPELLSVRQVLERTAGVLGRKPLMMSVPVLTPKLSAGWIHAVTRADAAIADHLVEGMLCDVSGSWPGYWADMPEHTLQPFEEATRQALDVCSGPSSTSGQWFERLAAAIALPA